MPSKIEVLKKYGGSELKGNILITGGAGFIGSHLVSKFLTMGYQVSIIDNFLTGKRENIEDDIGNLQALFESDIRDYESCRVATSGVDAVLHHAALASVPKSVEDPFLTNDINLTGTLNMLQASRENGVGKFIFASSAAIYGNNPDNPKREDMIPEPMSPYAVQKLAGEYYCSQYAALFGMDIISFRYFNVYGPNQDPDSQYAAAVPIFSRAINSGKPPTVFGDGEQTRDFVFVDDVAAANAMALEADALKGNVVNIAAGTTVTVNELLRIMNMIIGSDIETDFTDPRPGDIRHSQADITRAQKLLGYRPSIGLEDGLTRVMESPD